MGHILGTMVIDINDGVVYCRIPIQVVSNECKLSAEPNHAKRQAERVIVTLLSDVLIRQVVQTIYEVRVSFFDSFPLHPDGSLRDRLTFDEAHLAGSGYRLWQSLLEPTMSRYSQKP